MEGVLHIIGRLIRQRDEHLPADSREPSPPASNAPMEQERFIVKRHLWQTVNRAKHEAEVAGGRARAWSRLYFSVGLPAAILAAVAGATALASTAGRVPAGIIALVSAGLTAAATFLDSATRQTSYENLAAGWQVLAVDAGLNLDVDAENDEWLQKEARVKLQDLAYRERKLLQGKAPDAEAEAERAGQHPRGIRAAFVAGGEVCGGGELRSKAAIASPGLLAGQHPHARAP